MLGIKILQIKEFGDLGFTDLGFWEFRALEI